MVRVTQADLARELKVSAMTISLALRGHRSIPEATRRRVLALAEQRGYWHDPILSALGRMRWKRADVAFHGTVGFLMPHAAAGSNAQFYEGKLAVALRERLKILGYSLDLFGLDEYPDPLGLARVIDERGIVGLVHARLPRDGWINSFPWERFISVTLNYGYSPPPQHAVLLERFPNWLDLWKRLAERGYRRPALIAFDEPDAEDYALNEAGRLYASRCVLGTDPLEAFRLPTEGGFHDPDTRRALRQWGRRVRPDCLIGMNEFVLEWVLETMPEQAGRTGQCCLCLVGTPGRWSGFVEELTRTAEAAVELLHNQLRYGTLAGDVPPVRLIIPRPWHEGESLPPRTGGKPPPKTPRSLEAAPPVH